MELMLFKTFLPEMFLSFSILFFLMYNMYMTNSIFLNFPLTEIEIFNQLFMMLSIVFLLLFNLKIEEIQSSFMLVNSFGNLFFKKILIFFCILSLSSMISCFKVNKLNLFEYFVVYLFMIFSCLLMMSSCDLILIYILLELQTLSFFVLACFDRYSTFSTESGLKYFMLGSFISALFLCGCVFLYSSIGTLNLNNIELIFGNFDNNLYFLTIMSMMGSLFILMTFLFKLGSAPFHFWIPDMYEGAPMASTIIFSIMPKIPLSMLLLKFLNMLLVSFNFMKFLILFCGILSMFLGSMLALRQKRFKRLIIYSSIAQGGFMIAGCSFMTNIEDMAFMLFFLIIYLVSSVLIWLQFTTFYNSNMIISNFLNTNQIPFFMSNLSNFFHTNSILSFSFIIMFFSIGGLPPLSGFLSKLFILISIIKTNNFLLSFFMLLMSIFSIFYYVKIIKLMFFESKSNILFKPQNFLIFNKYFFFSLNNLILSFLLFILIYLFISPNFIIFFLEYFILKLFF